MAFLKKLDRKLETAAGHLGKVGRTLYEIGDATKEGLVKGVLHNPRRLLTGVDPFSTKLWNVILGTHDKPLVNVFGGPTNRTLNKIDASSLTRGVFHVADTIAAYFGTMGAAEGLGNAFSSMTAAPSAAPGAVPTGTGTTATTPAPGVAEVVSHANPAIAQPMSSGGVVGNTAGVTAPTTAAPVTSATTAVVPAAPSPIVNAGAADAGLSPVTLGPGVQRVGQSGLMRSLQSGGGLIKSAMAEPTVQAAAVGVGGKLAGGIMADRAEVKDRGRYNRNIGTELWPNAV